MHMNTLPRHPRTGVSALGWRNARPGEDGPRPIWPVLGGAEGDDQDAGDGDGDDDQDDGAGNQDDDGADSGGDDDPEGADQLGDAGKRALASMKEKWKSERQKRRDFERRLTEKDTAGDDKAAEQVRQQAEQEAQQRANARILRSEVRAAAAGKLADPKDALRFLDLDTFEVDEDGEIDGEEIADAIDDLLKNKPYLAAHGGRRFQGSGDGGAARKASRPKQLTRDDIKRMSPEQIEKAQSEGRLEDLLSGK